MNTMEQATDGLIEAILQSEEYLNYQAELARLSEQPELKAQVDEYRRRNFEFQSRPDIDFDKLDAFEREYESFLEKPVVEEFLAAELAFCRMMQGISLQITSALKFG